MGPVAPVIKRAAKAEAWLMGKTLNEDIIKQAAALVLDDAGPIDNPFRGNRDYLNHVLSVIIERGLSDIAYKTTQSTKVV